jgi:hypothetical protein
LKNINQFGGDRIIPEYRDAKVTPFKPIQQQNIERREKQEQKNAKDNIATKKLQMQQEMGLSQPLLELKLNQQPQQPAYPPVTQIYPSAYVPIPNPYYPAIANPAYPFQYEPNNVPIIQKKYISLGNGNGDVVAVSKFYEDVLPSDGAAIINSFNTLSERLILHNYIRGIFVKNGDGEEINMSGDIKTQSANLQISNLLSHIKLLEINPYHYNKTTGNVYKTLPNNFVLYRSCWPQKLNRYNQSECATSNVGMNIRIYLLSKYEDDLYKSNYLQRHYSDVWRELDYYQFVREEIIKPKLSPNFITLHSYYMTKNTGIQFGKFDLIRDQIDTKNQNIEKINVDIRNKLYIRYLEDKKYQDASEIVVFQDLIKYKLINSTEPVRAVTDKERREVISKRVDELYKNGYYRGLIDSEKCMIMLTEAPTNILYNWATRSYKINGPIRTSVQHGYHHDRVWESVFFQLLLSMLIMFEKKIMFKEFSLENNVFIKDLVQNEQNIGVWKYIYNGIEHFVPNYGYLLLIDSNFSEIKGTPPSYELTQNSNITHRIYSELFKDNNANGEIYKLCLDKMIDAFDRDNFGPTFTKYDGVAPTEDFLKKLDIIKIQLSNIKNKYFSTGLVYDEPNLLIDMKKFPETLSTLRCMNMVHSRIGTPIKDQEKQFKATDFDPNTKLGSIVIHRFRGVDVFGINLGPNPANPGHFKVLTARDIITNFDDRNNHNFEIRDVNNNDIFNYFVSPEHSYETGKQSTVLATYLISL